MNLFENTFDKDIANLTTTTISTIQSLIDANKEMVLFMGRSSCPFCRKFAPKIAKVAEDLGQVVYFVDSADQQDIENLTTFRKRYTIPTVPGLVVAKDGDVRVVCDSSQSVEEIAAFIRG